MKVTEAGCRGSSKRTVDRSPAALPQSHPPPPRIPGAWKHARTYAHAYTGRLRLRWDSRAPSNPSTHRPPVTTGGRQRNAALLPPGGIENTAPGATASNNSDNGEGGGGGGTFDWKAFAPHMVAIEEGKGESASGTGQEKVRRLTIATFTASDRSLCG